MNLMQDLMTMMTTMMMMMMMKLATGRALMMMLMRTMRRHYWSRNSMRHLSITPPRLLLCRKKVRVITAVNG